LGYGFGTSNWTDPNDPGGETGNFNLRGFLVGPTLGFNFQTDAFVIGAEAILTARGSMAKSVARSAASGRSARPRVFDFRPPARDWVMPSIACCSTAPPVAHLAAGLNYRFNWSGGPKP
jgi:hypothetical protein